MNAPRTRIRIRWDQIAACAATVASFAALALAFASQIAP